MFYFASTATTFSFFWLGWLLGFIVIEGVALRIKNKHASEAYSGGTLSELIWRVTRHNRFFAVIFTALWAVLTYHFFVG